MRDLWTYIFISVKILGDIRKTVVCMFTKNVQMAQIKLAFMNVRSIIATKAREKEESDNFASPEQQRKCAIF